MLIFRLLFANAIYWKLQVYLLSKHYRNTCQAANMTSGYQDWKSRYKMVSKSVYSVIGIAHDSTIRYSTEYEYSTQHTTEANRGE